MKKFLIPTIIVVVVTLAVVIARNNKNQTATNTSSATSTPEASSSTETSPGALKTGNQIGDLAADFTLTDYNNKTVKLSDFKGKSPVMINFWASWCPFCVQELPLMSKIQSQYSGKYLTLAINRGENQGTGKSFIEKLGVSDKFIYLNDPNDSIYSQYGGFSMPYSLFIDKNGVIKDVKLGPLQEAEFKDKIAKIVQ